MWDGAAAYRAEIGTRLFDKTNARNTTKFTSEVQ